MRRSIPVGRQARSTWSERSGSRTIERHAAGSVWSWLRDAFSPGRWQLVDRRALSRPAQKRNPPQV
jgi:hypothetical protein